MWGNMNGEYGKLSKGYSGNISGMTSSSRGFTKNRLIGYPESHDEERLMYYNKNAGNSTNTAHNVKTLNVGLSRMSAIGAVSLLVPGPKMIWHFGELGWDSSIFTCNNGTVNDASATIAGDCKLDTKPQPQWTGNWLGNTARSQIYNDWAKMITMKISEPVFSGTVSMANTSSLYPNIKITNAGLAASQLKDVLIIANFNVTAQNVTTGFSYPGTWYNLMDNTTINVTDVNAVMSIPAGQFRIYGNKQANLAIEDFEKGNSISLYPNPVSDYFTLNIPVTKVEVYSVSGQLVKSFTTNGSNDFKFSVSNLESGLYVIKALDENEKIQIMKFIKK
jgi:hypothetical protein